MKSAIVATILSLLLVGCGTTGKNIAPVVKMSNMQNCIVNINPTVESESGDAANTSSNTTDFKDLLDLELPIEKAMEAAIGGAVENKLLDGLITEDTPAVPMEEDVVPEEPTVEPEEVVGASIGRWNCKAYEDKSACRLPVNFSKYDFPIKFVFDNHCGSFDIPTAVSDNRDTPAYNRNDYVYFKYEKGSPVVFTRKGCTALNVEAFKTVEE